jgi:hypothetical protein
MHNPAQVAATSIRAQARDCSGDAHLDEIARYCRAAGSGATFADHFWGEHR